MITQLTRTLVVVALVLSATSGGASATTSPDGPAPAYGQPSDALHPDQDLLPVGDLDGNGIKDVVERRGGRQGTAHTEALIARDGRRGVELWRRSVVLTAEQQLVLQPLRLTGSNKPGLLLTISRDQSVTGNGTRTTTQLVMLDARSNTVAWRYTHTTLAYPTGDSGGQHCEPCTTFIGLVPAVSGPGQDLMLMTSDSLASTGPPPPSDVRLLRLHTGTGKATAVGSAFRSDSSEPRASVVGDLDGDGKEDIVVTSFVGRTLTAVSGRSGVVLWTGGRLPLRCCRNVTRAHAADGTSDLLVSTEEGESPSPGEPATQQRTPQIALVNGRTGEIRWRRSGESADPLGVSVGQPVVAVVDVDIDVATTSTLTSTVTAVDRLGVERWSTSLSLSSSTPGPYPDPTFGYTAEDAGDVNGDGMRELLIAQRTVDNAGRRDQELLVSGTTGQALLTGPAVHQVLRRGLTTVDADLVSTTKASGKELVLVGHDGTNGAAAWRRALPRTTGATFAYARAVQLFPQGCRSLLVVGGPRTFSGVVSGTGVVRWVVFPSSSDLFGSTLVAGTATAQTCG